MAVTGRSAHQFAKRVAGGGWWNDVVKVAHCKVCCGKSRFISSTEHRQPVEFALPASVLACASVAPSGRRRREIAW
jgi:hypothetical protein